MSRVRPVFVLLPALCGAVLLADIFPVSYLYDLVPVRAESLHHSSVVTAGSSQMMVVTGVAWGASQGTLRRFERPAGEVEGWREIGEPLTVSLGQRGFAWGLGLHDRSGLPGPEIDEGDRRTPAGVFRISGLFGFEPAQAHGSLRMPYRHLRADDLCVDDPASAYYNQIIATSQVPTPDWGSGEPMRSDGYGYQLGIVYDQNPLPAQPRRGSCYFVHIGPTTGGGFGCTMLDEADVLAIARWLDPAKSPVLVQLPEKVYRAVRGTWGLPAAE